MEQEILTEAQKTAIALIGAEPRLGSFYLSGGTALAAYYLHHRFSDDLDFFVFDGVDTIFLQEFVQQVKQILGAHTVRFERLYERNQFFFAFDNETELKVEFTRYPFRQLEEPSARSSVRVDSLRDIAANKLMALLDRFDPKDFIDLFFILQEMKLEDVRHDVEQKFGVRVDGIFLGGEFAKVSRIAALPKMLKPLAIEELKNFFESVAKSLRAEVIKG